MPSLLTRFHKLFLYLFSACDEFPTKWLAILIFMGFFMFLILAFDCALYGKKTGLSYKLLHCCRRRRRHEAEEMSAGMFSHHT